MDPPFWGGGCLTSVDLFAAKTPAHPPEGNEEGNEAAPGFGTTGKITTNISLHLGNRHGIHQHHLSGVDFLIFFDATKNTMGSSKLVGGWTTHLKIRGENKKCLKPPRSRWCSACLTLHCYSVHPFSWILEWIHWGFNVGVHLFTKWPYRHCEQPRANHNIDVQNHNPQLWRRIFTQNHSPFC